MGRDMTQMMAAFYTGKQKIELRETEVPKPGPGEVLVRVRPLITHRFPLAGVQEAFRTAADKSTRCLKVHVCP